MVKKAIYSKVDQSSITTQKEKDNWKVEKAINYKIE